MDKNARERTLTKLHAAQAREDAAEVGRLNRLLFPQFSPTRVNGEVHAEKLMRAKQTSRFVSVG